MIGDYVGYKISNMFFAIKCETAHMLTVTTINQIGPYDHFLREAEYSQPATFECVIENVSRIGHHVLTFKYPQSNETNLGSMQQYPPVSGFSFPANVSWVFPQKLNLFLEYNTHCLQLKCFFKN